MKVSDYIVEFLILKGIKEAFGYPGGSAANLIDSFSKYKDSIHAHVTYHEQGAAFAACGYAQTAGVPGVAYSIGGPGVTNLMTGIGHAYYDSIPLICLTGNVNTYEMSGSLNIRQRGFQEADNVSIVKPLVKYAECIQRVEDVRYCLEKAYSVALSGRKGPVVVDLPMDITKADVDVESMRGYEEEKAVENEEDFSQSISDLLSRSKRPLLIFGNGVRDDKYRPVLEKVVNSSGIPYVTSMIAIDVLGNNPHRYGFIGACGNRCANFIAAKSDLIISIGSRLDIRQVGFNRSYFAPDAKIIRVDIDPGELEYKVHDNEDAYCMDALKFLRVLENIDCSERFLEWNNICDTIKEKLKEDDNAWRPNRYIKAISEMIPSDSVITTDVGQNMVWTAQSFALKNGQRILFSGGFGSMGHALPSAIGAYYGRKQRPTYAITGDGGMQMNIQELQFVARENLPVKVIVFNNNALGMIRHFQETWFDSNYFQTKPEGGFTSPSFADIASAYGIRSMKICSESEVENCREWLQDSMPAVIEIKINEDTYEYPKLKFGQPNQDQEPLIDRGLYEELMSL